MSAVMENKKNGMVKGRLFVAFVMLLTYAGLQIMAAQFSSMAFMDSNVKFRAPFLFTELKFLFRAMAFPIYLLINTMVKVIKGRKIDLRRTIRRSTGGFHESRQTWQVTLKKFCLPLLLGLTLQTTFTIATAYIATGAATALVSVAVEISYILSWLVLKQKLLMIKTIFVGISFVGVALIGVASFAGSSALLGEEAIYIGVSCGLVTAICLSLYQADLGQTALIVTILHLGQALIFAPIPVTLKYTGQEVYSMSDMPYGLLLASWTGFGCGTMVYTYGLVLSSPFFMSIAELLILSGNTVIDPLFRGFVIRPEQIVGTCLIALAFTIIVMPNRLVSIRIRSQRSSSPAGLPSSESATKIVPEADLSDTNSTNEQEVSVSENVLPVKSEFDLAVESDSWDSLELGQKPDEVLGIENTKF